jgi:hypothetical protein
MAWLLAIVGVPHAVQSATAMDALGLHNISFARTKLRSISAIREMRLQNDYRICKAARATELGGSNGDLC